MKVDFINSHYRRFFWRHCIEIMWAIFKCLSQGRLTLREDVWKLEKNMANYVGTKYCATTNSGTDALFLSLLALGIGKGDEVITVSNTFIASIQAIVHTGATPILIDVKEDELMDVEQLESAITPRTKAIMPIHYTGNVADMREITRIAKKYKLYVVEDAAQALGATQAGKKAGSFGMVGCFSFNNAKLLGGFCDGGAVTTNNRKLYETICLLRNHWNVHQLSVDRNDYPQPKEMRWAWKSRLSNVNAAFLNVKFKYYKQALKRRKEIAETYTLGLSGLPIKLPIFYEGAVIQEYHVRCKQREKLVAFLKKKGIETLIRDSVPNHKMKGLGLSHWDLPITEQLAKEVFRLPLHEHLKDSEVRYIIKSIKEFFNQ